MLIDGCRRDVGHELRRRATVERGYVALARATGTVALRSLSSPSLAEN